MYSIPKRQIITDIQSGMRDRDLMEKYGLAPRPFQRVLHRLVLEEAIDHDDLYEKSQTYREISDVISSRRHPRVHIPMAIRVLGNGGSQSGFIRDVSETGLRVAGIAAEKGESIALSVPLKEIPVIGPIKFEATCRRSERKGKQKKFAVVGFEITAMSDEARRRFLRLIDFFRPPMREKTSDSFQGLGMPATMPVTKSCDFSGTVEDVDILDMVHFMLLNRQKMLLDVRSSQGDSCRLYIADGNIVHAVGDNLNGLEAFMACMSFEGGNFSSLRWQEPEERSILEPGELLLIEAARRRDEITGRCTLTN